MVFDQWYNRFNPNVRLFAHRPPNPLFCIIRSPQWYHHQHWLVAIRSLDQPVILSLPLKASSWSCFWCMQMCLSILMRPQCVYMRWTSTRSHHQCHSWMDRVLAADTSVPVGGFICSWDSDDTMTITVSYHPIIMYTCCCWQYRKYNADSTWCWLAWPIHTNIRSMRT